MDQQPQDPRTDRRRPGGDGPAIPGHAMTSRARGLRQVRRWSNGTAAALIAATVLTTGYFARTGAPGTPWTPTAAVAAGATGATGIAGQPGTGAGPHRPCVSVPVATSGGSGVTRQTVIRSCGTGTSVPVVISTGRAQERGDS